MGVDATGSFSSTEAIRFGWEKTKTNLKPLLLIGLVGFFLALVNQALANPQGAVGAPLLVLVVQALQVGVTLAFIRAALALHDGKPVDLSRPAELLSGYFMFLLVTVLYWLIVAAGMILLVVPGVIWAIQLGFAGFIVADRKKIDAIQALRESSRLTKGVKWPLLGFGLLLFGLNLLGAIVLGIGLFLTIPISAIAAAYVFRRLQVRVGAAPEPVRPPPPITQPQVPVTP